MERKMIEKDALGRDVLKAPIILYIGKEIFSPLKTIVIGISGNNAPLEVPLSVQNMPFLKNYGLVTALPEDALSLGFYSKRIADRFKWNDSNMRKYLENLNEISPASLVSLFLREIAIYLDERYDDHISKSENLFIISKVNGKVRKFPTHFISKTNIKSIAYFRSEAEALFALKVIKEGMNYQW